MIIRLYHSHYGIVDLDEKGVKKFGLGLIGLSYEDDERYDLPEFTDKAVSYTVVR